MSLGAELLSIIAILLVVTLVFGLTVAIWGWTGTRTRAIGATGKYN